MLVPIVVVVIVVITLAVLVPIVVAIIMLTALVPIVVVPAALVANRRRHHQVIGVGSAVIVDHRDGDGVATGLGVLVFEANR